MLGKHRWRKHEDIIVGAFTLAGKTTSADKRAIAALLGLSENQVSARMEDFILLRNGYTGDRHWAKQECRVHDALGLI